MNHDTNTDQAYYALWLMPREEEAEQLRQLIATLSWRYQGPHFEPHITLLGGFEGARDKIITQSAEVASDMNPLTLKLEGCSYSDHYYQSLFIQVEDHETLWGVRKRAKDLLGGPMPKPFVPHISLMYGDYPYWVKTGLVKELAGSYPRNVRIDRLALYDINNAPQHWQCVSSFPLESP